MAVEKNIKINVDAKDAISQVDELKTGVKETNTAAEDSKSSFGKMKSGVGAVGTAFKALGIGLIVAAFAKLAEMVSQNQVVMDKLSIASEAIGAVFQKLIQAAIQVGTSLTSAFSDPKQAVVELWQSIKQNIVDRFEGLIDTFGALGKVIRGVFKRDLDLIKEGAGEAKTGLIQLATGMTEVEQAGFVENLKSTVEELKNTTKAAVEYGKAITALRNEVKLAEANQRQLQLTYQRDAELQRQIRDDISLTFEERIAANEELGRILDEQFAEEQALAQKKIDLAQLELSQNKDNVDLQVALINAKTELADLDERITGQRSEQLTNLKALEAEQAAAIKETADAEAKRLADAQAAADKSVAIAKEEAAKKIEIERALAATRRDIVANSLGQVASLLGEQSKAGKALAVGQALINTYSAAAAALAPPPIGAGPIFGPIAAIGAVAAGMANVKQILSTKLPGDSGGGGGGGPEPAVPQDTGLGPMSPNMEAVEQPTLGGGSQPAQAYVVENDISNAQALQNELDIQATL
tara:strand:+ start:553 stop:2127 length:1575 start_codon:yes stop_codon:yes gene_type:complete